MKTMKVNHVCAGGPYLFIDGKKMDEECFLHILVKGPNPQFEGPEVEDGEFPDPDPGWVGVGVVGLVGGFGEVLWWVH